MGFDINNGVSPADEMITALLTILESPIFISLMIALFVVNGFRFFVTGSSDALKVGFGCLMLSGQAILVKTMFGIETDIEYSDTTKTVALVLAVVVIGIGIATAFFAFNRDDHTSDENQVDEVESEQPEHIRESQTVEKVQPGSNVEVAEIKKTRKIIID